ncbi:MAG: hypothetical protein DRI90_22280 [Deltaproteobacteria bacterium]|nr:MAG: hypothetical protein DRI90_22280 [Deltaproteobacteria bacterium]
MHSRLLFGAALLLLGAGCFNSKLAVTERASKEFQCPAPQVRVEKLGGGAYRIFACGHQATYACSPRMEMCLKEAGSVPVVGAAPAATMPPTGPPHQFPGATQPGPAAAPAQPGWPGAATYPGNR